MEEDLNKILNIGGQEFSLSDLANLDLSDVEETRSTAFPAGVFIFEITADPVPVLATFNVPDNREGALPNTKYDIPGVTFTFKCIDVVAMPTTQIDRAPSPKPEDVIGKSFTETYFMRELPKDLGRVVSFLNDVGVGQKGALKDLLMASVGCRFKGMIRRKFKKGDEDVIYTNLNRDKVEAIAA